MTDQQWVLDKLTKISLADRPTECFRYCDTGEFRRQYTSPQGIQISLKFTGETGTTHQFQPGRVRNYRQMQLFVSTVWHCCGLEVWNKGHWQWYEWVRLIASEAHKHHQCKFQHLSHVLHSATETCNMSRQPNTDINNTWLTSQNNTNMHDLHSQVSFGQYAWQA